MSNPAVGELTDDQESNLSLFFEVVEEIKSQMKAISILRNHLQILQEETESLNSTDSCNDLQFLKGETKPQMKIISILRNHLQIMREEIESLNSTDPCDDLQFLKGETKPQMKAISILRNHLEILHEEAKSLNSTDRYNDLQFFNRESKFASSPEYIERPWGLMVSTMDKILEKAATIKSSLRALNCSNIANRYVPKPGFKKGSPVDLTRLSETSGLRTELREMMNGFRSLKERILAEHKEGQVGGDLEMERQKIESGFAKLDQVFLDMGVMVEVEEEEVNDHMENVAMEEDKLEEESVS